MKTAAKRQPKKRDMRLKIVKNDPWLEPFNDAIKGRHDHVLHKLNELTGERSPCRSLLAAIFISVFTRHPVNGFSVNGHLMLQKFISLAILIIGRKMKPIALNLLVTVVIGK